MEDEDAFAEFKVAPTAAAGETYGAGAIRSAWKQGESSVRLGMLSEGQKLSIGVQVQFETHDDDDGSSGASLVELRDVPRIELRAELVGVRMPERAGVAFAPSTPLTRAGCVWEVMADRKQLQFDQSADKVRQIVWFVFRSCLPKVRSLRSGVCG